MTLHSTVTHERLAQLNRDGFILIPNALPAERVDQWKTILYALYDRGAYEISNGVGNVAFEKLLALEPELAGELVGHGSIVPFLRAIMGKQCQLRSLRDHVNPAAYLQEWHMDFYDYYYQAEKSEAKNPTLGLCVNSTFYLTDNTPDRARLTFVKNCLDRPVPKELVPFLRYTED